MPEPDPELSVVVALISGEEQELERCLTALRAQVGAPPFEVVVPVDEPCFSVLGLQSRFPEVRFLKMDGVDTRAARAGASREHHDTLRTAGLRAARGSFVLLTEDHARGDPSLCAALVNALHERRAAGGVGGAVEFGGSGLLPFAVYLCDFSRYANPLVEGPAEFVSDSCVAYRRVALAAVAEAWRDDYHETIVHDALARRGFELHLTGRGVVFQQRGGLTLGVALRERCVWGRSYAATRVAGQPFARRLAFALGTPLLPFVLTARIVRGVLRRRRHLWRTFAALPLLLLLQSAWAFGELCGYATGRVTPGRR